MKKTLKRLSIIISVVLLSILVYFKLESNKAENNNIAELANIKGSYQPVKALVIEAEQANTSISTNGFLESASDINVISETQGRITNVYKEKGDFVNAGDVIAKVDDELLAAQLGATEAAYMQLQKEVKRFTKLHAENAITTQKLEEIKLNLETTESNYIAAKRQFSDTEIKAPVSGYIENDFIDLGQFLGGGSVVCTIIDIKNLKLQINISEHDYRSVQLNQLVDIYSSVYPDTHFEGRIRYIGKKAGYGNAFNAEIEVVNNNKQMLQAGMFVSVHINNQEMKESICIPRRAINGSLKDAYVYVVQDGIAVKRKVITGKNIDDKVAIISGLNVGELLVVEGNYSISDGIKVKVVN